MSIVQETQKSEWLEETRRKAWADFKKLPPPAKTAETWRRVDFNQWRTHLLPEKSVETAFDPPAPLDAELARKGVILTSLEEAALRHSSLVEPYLKNLSVSLDFRALEAANLSRFKGGYFLYVPKGLRVEKPFELAFVQKPQDAFAFPRVLAIVEEGAEAVIVESHFAEETKAAVNRRTSSIAFSRLVVGPNARARYFYDQSLSLNTVHFWHQRADLSSGAFLQHYSTLLGSVLHKSELDVRLNGEGARSELYGILLGAVNQHFDPHTVQWHQRSKTSSDLLFRAALRDRARSVYTGLIRIEKEAVGCDAYQQNNNLLLSNEARADSTPILEILNNEVHCKHGATVGPVSQDELFYLCSRGLTPEEATKMLVMGFFDPILSKLPLDHQKERILRGIEERLG